MCRLRYMSELPGTDVAIETADIILVKSNPNDVAAIIGLAMATYGHDQFVWFAGQRILIV